MRVPAVVEHEEGAGAEKQFAFAFRNVSDGDGPNTKLPVTLRVETVAQPRAES